MLCVVSLFVVAAFLRVYNINWGSPWYFHPDERSNIVYPILESTSPLLLDQKNFDTGPLPLVVIKNTLALAQKIPFIPTTDTTQTIIVISRLYSIVFSLLLSLLLFLFTKKHFGKITAFFVLFLGTFSVGFIQFAHFGTIEVWETFVSFIIFLFSYPLVKNPSHKRLALLGLLIGIGASIKLFGFILLAPVSFAFLLSFLKKPFTKKLLLQKSLFLLGGFFILILTTILAFLITSPQLLLHFSDVQKSIRFESTVADGKQPIFFTQSFQQTIPIFFQLTKVFPFLLNPLLTILFIGSFFLYCFRAIKEKNMLFLCMIVFFLALFIPEAILFVKWTRYMLPTLPFVYVLLALDLSSIYAMFWPQKKQTFNSILSLITVLFVCAFSALFATSFFITVYLHKDTRIAAYDFLEQHFSRQAPILSEPFDIGLMQFSQNYLNIKTPDIYYLDVDKTIQKDTTKNLTESSLIVLPSQRLVRSRLMNPQDFPVGNRFYSELFLRKLGFVKIYETPCDVFCKITYLSNPLFSYEETASVFDRPTVFIFMKTINHTEQEYKKILGI